MAHMPHASQLKVVVVDDDAINALLLSEICTAAGWEVAGCAGSSGGALALVREAAPDCLIVDFKLDGERTGLDLVADVKAIRPELFTIMITGWDINDIAARIDGAYPDRMLRKPVPPNILMDMLDGLAAETNVLEMRRA